MPLVLVDLVVAHLIALHEVGSNNPDGVEIKKLKDENGIPLDGIPFHLYYIVKDILGVVVFLIVFCSIMFFAPEDGGYEDLVVVLFYPVLGAHSSPLICGGPTPPPRPRPRLSPAWDW